MREFRAFVMNSDGHVKGRHDLLCEDEEVAKEQAKQLLDGHAIELWEGARRIARFTPEH